MSDIYVVMSIVMVIWVAVFGYMMRIDREVRTLDEKFQNFLDETGRN
jgi:CcmD family protein